MKTSLAIKTLFRTVGKTLFTFLLIAVLTFSLFLQLAEYHATKREFEQNLDMYYGTGFVEKQEAGFAGHDALQYPYYLGTDPRLDSADLPDFSSFDYPSLTGVEVEELAELPYVSTMEQRYMTAGRGAYPRLRDDNTLWDYNARAIVEGTLTGHCAAVYSAAENGENGAARLGDSRLLAGDLDMDIFTAVAPKWKAFHAASLAYEASMNRSEEEKTRPDEVPWQSPEGDVEEGELFVNLSAARANGDFYYFWEGKWETRPATRYYWFMADDWVPESTEGYGNAVRDTYVINNILLKNYAYGRDVHRNWKAGDRFVFVLRFSRTYNAMDPLYQGVTPHIYDWASEHACPAVWNITDAPENYLELPEYAPLKQLIEITESDLNTLDVVYTDDMSTIKLVHDGKMALTDGRWITPEDTETGARVCMLDEKFARTYKLQVGDTLPLELGDKLFEQFYNLGAIASVPERYADNWTDAEFEIVGLYKTAGGSSVGAREPNWTYSVNTVFVPLSSLPETVDLTNHEYAPGEFTFQVNNAWDIASFLDETAPRIEAMGLTLMFDDGGWMEVYKPYVEAQRIAMIRIVLLAAVTVMATAFVVYLFISRKKKDYAIMRALGTPRRKSGTSLLVPLLVLAVASVLVGLVTAAVYIGRMSQLGQPPLGLALLCGLAVLLLTLLLALGMLLNLGRKSPLVLLQDGGKSRKAAKAELAHAVAAMPAADRQAAAMPGTLERPRKPHSVRFVLRYVFRHMRRSAVKSLLAILVAVLMVAAVAQLGHMREVYDRLRTDTVVTAQFNNSLILPRCKDLEADGLTEGLYYERSLDGVAVLDYGATSEIRIAVTNDIAKYTGRDGEITYAPGYGPEDMGVTGKYVVLGKTLMEQSGVALGDTVRLCKRPAVESFIRVELQRLKSEYPDQYPDDASSLWGVWPEYMEAELDKLCDCLTVIGSVSTGDSSYDGMAFSPGLEITKQFMADSLMDFVEFRVADNARAQEVKNLGQELTNNRPGAFSIDIEKLESVERTATLLEALYPIVIALALLIGGCLCMLIILQSTKEAAIMRILGTTKRKTRAMLSLEQIILALSGLVLGLGVMAAIHRANFITIAPQTGLFAGVYLLIAALASLVSAGIATKKNLLELLQTKE